MIKDIFKNILFLYKNIFHWTFSKVLISISSYLLWILVSIPFLLLFLFIIYISPLDFSKIFAIIYSLMTIWLNWVFNFIQESQNGIFWLILILTSFISIIFTLFLWISYSKVLISKLNLKYLENKKLKFKKNEYFNIKLFIKASKIFSIILSYLIAIFIIFCIFFLISFFLFWWTNLWVEAFRWSSNFHYFSLSILILVVIFSLIWLFLLYRTLFSYFIILENKDYSASKAIKKSIKITKWRKKIIKFIIINLILFLLYFPFSYLQQSIDESNRVMNYYIYLNNKKALNQEFIKNEKVNENYDYNTLSLRYKEYSNKELIWKSRFLYIMQILYFIFNFIFIYGILDLIYASFYKRELSK